MPNWLWAITLLYICVIGPQWCNLMSKKSPKLLLTHWVHVTHICVSNLTIIDSDNGLSTDWQNAIIWTNAWILLIGPLWRKFNGILIEIHIFPFKKMHLKMLSAKWQPLCLGLNVLTTIYIQCINESHYKAIQYYRMGYRPIAPRSLKYTGFWIHKRHIFPSSCVYYIL